MRHKQARRVILLVIVVHILAQIACGTGPAGPGTVSPGQPAVEATATPASEPDDGLNSGEGEASPGENSGEETVPTQEVGTVEGQVMSFVPHSGDITVFVAGREDIWSAADDDGFFRLEDVPAGLQLIVAESPGGSDYQQVTVTSGQVHSVDLSVRSWVPFVSGLNAAGGVVLQDDVPVEGAKVWPVSSLTHFATDSGLLFVTDDEGYFGFSHYMGEPIIAVAGDRWQIAFLESWAITEIELSRTGAVATPPNVPESASISRRDVLDGPPPPFELLPFELLPFELPQLERPQLELLPED